MSFAIWINKCRSDADGSSIYGECLSGDCFGEDFDFQGDAIVLSPEGNRDNIKLDLETIHSYDHGFGWRTSLKDNALEGNLISNLKNIHVVYNGEVKFVSNEKYANLFKKRGVSVIPVCMSSGWFGILHYSRTGFFKRNDIIKLFAFSSAKELALEPGIVYAPSILQFPERQKDSFYEIGRILPFA